MPSGGSSEHDRAVTVQIGAVILFGFLIVALSTYQATVVPDQNQQVEFRHNQEVQTDLIQLANGVSATGRTGMSASAAVSLGTRYPSRSVFVNPAPASGRVSTTDPPGSPNVTVENVTVLSTDGGGAGEANDYWRTDRNFSTRFVVYEPRYNNYREAPTTRYESGVVFNEFPSGRTLNLTGQRIVDGNRITLILVRGALSRDGVGTVSVDPSAVSVVTRRERVKGTMNLTIPTTRSASVWRGPTLLNVNENAYVEDVTDVAGDRVKIHLNDSKTYSLGLALVNVGSDSLPEPANAYVDVEDAPTTANNGSTREVAVEVRDEYGNPAEAVEVTAETDGAGEFAESVVTTDEDGVAVFEYTPGATGTEELRFSYDGLGGFDATTPADANVTVTVTAGAGDAGGDGTSSINPPESVVLVDSYRNKDDKSVAVLELENRGNEMVNSSQARINFYLSSKTGNTNKTQAELTTAAESPNLSIGGPLKNATIAFAPNETKYVCYDFENTLYKDEFFVTSYTFDKYGDEQYFVGLNQQQSVICDVSGGGGGGGGSDLSSVTANDLSGTTNQTQVLTFKLGNNLSNGETITVDLSDTDRTGNEAIVYSGGASTAGPGTASRSARTVTYTAAGSEQAGDTISVTVWADPEKNANKSGNNGGSRPTYTVTFTGPDGDSVSDTFVVN